MEAGKISYFLPTSSIPRLASSSALLFIFVIYSKSSYENDEPFHSVNLS